MQPFYEYGNYCVFLYSVYMVVDKWKKTNEALKVVHALLVFGVLYLIVSRLLNGYGYDNKYSSLYIYDLTLINLFTYGIIDNTWAKLKSFSFLLYIYVCINLATIILYPEGLYGTDVYSQNWYLGYKNVMIRTILPGVTLNTLCSIHDFGKLCIKDYVLMFVSIYSVYLVGSSTSIAMLCIFILGVLIWHIKGLILRPLIFKCFVIVSAISIAFTIFSFQEYLAPLIDGLFDKDTTFTGRTFVWAFTLIRLLDSPIIGFGWHTADEWRNVLGFYDMSGFDMGFSHPHNYILYVLLQGGLLYMLLIIYIFYYLSKKCKVYNAEIYFLTLMYLAFFIEGITESLTGAIFFMPLLGLYANFISNTKLKN